VVITKYSPTLPILRLILPILRFSGLLSINEGSPWGPVIPFDGKCSVTPSYLANLLVKKKFHPSFFAGSLMVTDGKTFLSQRH
jgi:hypothetical protein